MGIVARLRGTAALPATCNGSGGNTSQRPALRIKARATLTRSSSLGAPGCLVMRYATILAEACRSPSSTGAWQTFQREAGY